MSTESRRPLIHLYSDGLSIRLFRRAFRIRRRWVRGLAVGAEWKPGPWWCEKWTHSSLTIFVGPVAFVVEHLATEATP